MCGSDAWRMIQTERRANQITTSGPQQDLSLQGTITYLPDTIPDPLCALLRGAGVSVDRVVRGRLIERNSNFAIDNWSLELEVRLSEDEGRAILGSLWSDVFRDSEEDILGYRILCSCTFANQFLVPVLCLG